MAEILPDVQYANLYGPTEITDACTYYMVDREFSDEEPLPIGFPMPNTDILVLNEKNEPVTGEEPGELAGKLVLEAHFEPVLCGNAGGQCC